MATDAPVRLSSDTSLHTAQGETPGAGCLIEPLDSFETGCGLSAIGPAPGSVRQGSGTMASTTQTMLHRLRHDREAVPAGARQRHFNLTWMAIAIGVAVSAVLAYNLVFAGTDSRTAATPPVAVAPTDESPAAAVSAAALAQQADQAAGDAFDRLAADPGPFDRDRVWNELSQHTIQPQLGTWFQTIQGMKLRHQYVVGTADEHYKVLSEDDSHVRLSVCSSSHMRTLDSRTGAELSVDPADFNAFTVDVVKTSEGPWKVERTAPAGDPGGTLCTPDS